MLRHNILWLVPMSRVSVHDTALNCHVARQHFRAAFDGSSGRAEAVIEFVFGCVGRRCRDCRSPSEKWRSGDPLLASAHARLQTRDDAGYRGANRLSQGDGLGT